jgi:hypothetical protein
MQSGLSVEHFSLSCPYASPRLVPWVRKPVKNES